MACRRRRAYPAAAVRRAKPARAARTVPTRVLAGRHDRMFPLDFQRRVARERLAIDVEEIDGGHMLALSNPAGLADRLEAFASNPTPAT